MKILLKLLKISASQEHKDNKANYTQDKTVSDGEPCILNNNPPLSGTANGFKKRFKPLNRILDPHEVFGSRFTELNNLKSPKTSSECGLVTEETNCNNFVELEPNDMIKKEYILLSTKLDSSNSSNINNKNDNEKTTHIKSSESLIKGNLPHQEKTGMLITDLKKIRELRQNISLKDHKEIMSLNKKIMIDFVSNIEQLKKKTIRGFSSKCTYPHNKESLSCLYSYFLKAKITTMGNLSLLDILISEIEYNNEIMIYCFLASNTYRILDFMIENIGKLDITPVFFYNVGLFMEKYWSHGFGGRFPIAWETGPGNRKYKKLSVFIKAYRSLGVHNEMSLPGIFDEINVEECVQIQLEIVTLYNLVKEKYRQYFA